MDNEKTTNMPLLFACAGGSSVGQLANDACRELSREGKGKIYCLAGVGGHIAGIIDTAKKAEAVIAVDGCGVRCALKALEAADVPVTEHIVLTDFGFAKSTELWPEVATINAAKTAILNNMK